MSSAPIVPPPLSLDYTRRLGLVPWAVHKPDVTVKAMDGTVTVFDCPLFENPYEHSFAATHRNSDLIRDLFCRIEMQLGSRTKRPEFFVAGEEERVCIHESKGWLTEYVREHNGLPEIFVLYKYVKPLVCYFCGAYEEREAIKAAGGKWDVKRKQWYLPETYEYRRGADGLFAISDWFGDGVGLTFSVCGVHERFVAEPSKHSAWRQTKGRGFSSRAT